ncbi:hypothetical protein EDB19DRAFT_248743 [Suillus lakei]|nr:hypothetical protein EDB19DRAFT_248743 [Suillus lakei]
MPIYLRRVFLVMIFPSISDRACTVLARKTVSQIALLSVHSPLRYLKKRAPCQSLPNLRMSQLERIVANKQ